MGSGKQELATQAIGKLPIRDQRYLSTPRQGVIKLKSTKLLVLNASLKPMKSGCIPRVARSTVICAFFAMLVLWPSFAAPAESEAKKVPRAELAHGKIGADEWEAAVMAPEFIQEREEGDVCLSISFLEVWPRQEIAEGNEAAQCGELGMHEIMFESYTKHRGHKRPHSAVAFLLDESASRVVLKLKGHAPEIIRLRHLPSQAVTNGRQLAYFARGYAQPFCLQRLVAYDAAGQRVAHLAGRSCL